MSEHHLKNKLLSAYQYFNSIGHERNSARVKQLAQKMIEEEFAIAFAGHFSAGKSKMINYLCGAQLLPSSPIPTSANLVKVYSGKEEYARVFFKEGKTRKYLAPYDYDLVRSFCKDGDQVTVIELSHNNLTLPDNVVVMDTPGIDSTDDAHRKATEDAIHMADIIFYVMDYNHVQSELNFSFTRELTKAGKKVYLVVNQIDKHIEGELTFQSFVDSTTNAFKGWGVEPAGIFFTSLKELNHPENQISQLQQVLWNHVELRDKLLIESINASLKKIFDEYLYEVNNANAEQIAAAQDIMKALPEEKLNRIKEDFIELKSELKALSKEWEPNFKKGIEKILENAYLTPTSTRDLAASYLESCQPNFKVGFFFNRKTKTEAEKIRRKDLFFNDIKEKTRSQIEWHIKTFLLNFIRETAIDNNIIVNEIQALKIELSEDILTSSMREGAKLTQDGSYVINYSINIAEAIKSETRLVIAQIKDRIKNLLDVRKEQRMADINKQLSSISEYTDALTLLTDHDNNKQKVSCKVYSILNVEQVDVGNFFDIFQIEKMEEELVILEPNIAEKEIISNKEEIKTVKDSHFKQETILHEDNHGIDKLKEMADRLNNTAKHIAVLPGMHCMAKELMARAERLNNKGFMVTLFGAFSAGKSSFANSLLGTNLLPVSPNPTTAAINKIMPVDAQHPHGTVLIKLKDREMLLSDINKALSVFDIKINSLDEAGAFIGKALADSRTTLQRQKSFLRAFRNGYRQLANDLGTLLHRKLDEFASFAAEEERSCFVEWIEVYYDCPFTAQGITLVDTPGADSINARHTNMSFNFIRQSDVILFVTYYNHAFSKADREFLIQLGRVKDAFQLDKMFFIVNAIDLSENDEEAADVVNYVRQQLREYGVHKPQLHALSSKQNLKDKLENKERTYPFEEAFYHFVFNDLTDIAIDLAKQEQQRAERLVDELIKASQEDVSIKAKRKILLHEHQQSSENLLAELDSRELTNAMEQELEELTFYVKQRVFLRFIDFFRESFNPADIRSGSSNDKALRECLKQLLNSIGFDLAQELRATTLRLEKYLQRTVLRWRSNLGDKLREVDREITLSRPKVDFESGLEFQAAFTELNLNDFNKTLNYFKSARHFFE